MIVVLSMKPTPANRPIEKETLRRVLNPDVNISFPIKSTTKSHFHGHSFSAVKNRLIFSTKTFATKQSKLVAKSPLEGS